MAQQPPRRREEAEKPIERREEERDPRPMQAGGVALEPPETSASKLQAAAGTFREIGRFLRHFGELDQAIEAALGAEAFAARRTRDGTQAETALQALEQQATERRAELVALEDKKRTVQAQITADQRELQTVKEGLAAARREQASALARDRQSAEEELRQVQLDIRHHQGELARLKDETASYLRGLSTAAG